MSRKHFEALAEAIAEIKAVFDRQRMALLVGNVCAECNERFDWQRWNTACGVRK